LAVFFLSLLLSRPVESAPTISDNTLKVETIASGLSSPTSMAFIDSKNILVLEKNTGKVRFISNNILKSNPVLTVPVNTDSERGLLGIATFTTTTPGGNTKIFVFLYYTTKDGTQIRNKLYRYEWTGSALINPSLVLSLPGLPGPNHDGGKLLISTDKRL
jgi:glucose/arabinose dehydrogenase